MAKKEKSTFNYNAELKTLQEQGPERLYFLTGPEDYLRECFLTELRRRCVAEEDSFSCRRMNGPVIDLGELTEAVDALPFFSERSYVEVRDYDINRCRDAECERLKKIAADIPDYCTLVFSFSSSCEPDGRLAATKALKKLGRSIEFSEQEQGALTRWVMNRFKALGKQINPTDAEYLIFLSGTRMNGLIPEIEKAASFAAGDTVSRGDIDATANRVPEADVFAMTDLIAQRRFDGAAALLSDLLGSKDNHPILLNALIGQQMRRMYALKVGQAAGRSRPDLKELCGVRFDFAFDKLVTAAKPFSEAQLGRIVKLCAEYDYKMKSTGMDADVLIREMFARIAAEA